MRGRIILLINLFSRQIDIRAETIVAKMKLDPIIMNTYYLMLFVSHWILFQIILKSNSVMKMKKGLLSEAMKLGSGGEIIAILLN